jgi:TetR/AcrR family transcriptional repressor of mexJK operon
MEEIVGKSTWLAGADFSLADLKGFSILAGVLCLYPEILNENEALGHGDACNRWNAGLPFRRCRTWFRKHYGLSVADAAGGSLAVGGPLNYDDTSRTEPFGLVTRPGNVMSRRKAVEKFAESQQTKKEMEVLRVASDYFLSHGYKGTSINAMARDSGISKESIYRYFSSKKDLFEAVIAKELSEYEEKLRFLNIEFDSMALDEALRATAESMLGAVSNEKTLALRRLIFQEKERSPDIGQYYYKIGPQEAYSYLEKIFAAHQDETDYKPAKLSHYFVALALHYTMLRHECGVMKPLSRAKIRNLAAEVTEDFLRAYFN